MTSAEDIRRLTARIVKDRNDDGGVGSDCGVTSRWGYDDISRCCGCGERAWMGDGGAGGQCGGFGKEA